MPSRRFSIISSLGLALLLAGGCQPADEPAEVTPPVLERDLRERVSVSGVSSGGYMAVQTHIAFADLVAAVGVVAAGPYHCAGGSVQTALGACMSGDGIDVAPLVEFTKTAAAAGNVASLDDIAASRVWLFHSPVDGVVSQRAGDALHDFYRELAPADAIVYRNGFDAAHGLPTVDKGEACDTMGGDFLNACDFDTAGEVLAHAYGELDDRADSAVDANLVSVDLSAYFDDGSSVAESGYAYVPASCRDDLGSCRLHVVFHGCRQGAEFIANRFVKKAGYNEWAETNDIVLVYPQIEKSMFNPQGCWDWWGYTDADYDTRKGKQVAGVQALIIAFASGEFPAL